MVAAAEASVSWLRAVNSVLATALVVRTPAEPDAAIYEANWLAAARTGSPPILSMPPSQLVFAVPGAAPPMPTAVPEAAPPILPAAVPEAAPPILPAAVPEAAPPTMPAAVPEAAPPIMLAAVPIPAPPNMPAAVPVAAPPIMPAAVPAPISACMDRLHAAAEAGPPLMPEVPVGRVWPTAHKAGVPQQPTRPPPAHLLSAVETIDEDDSSDWSEYKSPTWNGQVPEEFFDVPGATISNQLLGASSSSTTREPSVKHVKQESNGKKRPFEIVNPRFEFSHGTRM